MKSEKIGRTQKNTDFTSRMAAFTTGILEPLKNEEGQGLTEYALIVGVIALVCIAAISSVGSNIFDAFFVKIQGWLSSI